MTSATLYAGIGGTCLAAEWALGCSTSWQLDLVGGEVRRRHWPDALQIEADVATVDPDDLPAVDVLAASPACQDLSCAGSGAGLVEGTRTGPTYRHLLRFAGARLTDEGFVRDEHRRWLPEVVIIENVPALLSRWRARVESDWHRLGYGLTWVRARALDVGAPHIRRRVFVVAVREGAGGRVLDAPRDGEWRPDGLRVWPTPTARDDRTGGGRRHTRGGTCLADEAGDQAGGGRLSADWVETLMGLPVGWTLPVGPRLEVDPDPRWPRGRYPADWDRSVEWPGYDWEPARVLPAGPAVPGRPARLRALGNLCVPAQAALALFTALSAPRQAALPLAVRSESRYV